MIKWWKKKRREARCEHDWKPKSRLVGATMDWGAAPVRMYTLYKQCSHCGKIKDVREGMIIAGERRLWPEYYESEPPYWPLDENGERLEIAKL